MKVELQVMSQRYCKSCRQGVCEVTLNNIVGELTIADGLTPNSFEDIKVGDVVKITNDYDEFITDKIVSIRLFDEFNLDFITKTVSYRLTIKE